MSRDLSRDVKSVKKKSNNFYCKDCDYLAYQKSHYDKHLSSKKHQKNCQKVLKKCQKVLKKSVKSVNLDSKKSVKSVKKVLKFGVKKVLIKFT